MAITTINEIAEGLAQAQNLIISKASIANMLTGGFASLWRATGTPGQGSIPGAAAVCNNSLTGALSFNNFGANTGYLASVSMIPSNSSMSICIADRLVHMGGLSGTTTTSQAVGCNAAVTSENLANRIGSANFSELQWWLEIYTDIGTTGVTANVVYTDQDGNSANTQITIGGASPANRAGRLFPIIPTITTDYIRSIENIHHATTATAGSYGITVTKPLAWMPLDLGNAGKTFDWAQLGLPSVANNACLMMIAVCGTTSTGTLNGTVKLIQN